MAETVWASMTMKRGMEEGALKLINAVRRQTEREQPDALVYLVHRILGADGKPTRDVRFYERYRTKAAVTAHLDSTSWKALVANWDAHFEGHVPDKTHAVFDPLVRIGGFAREGAIPIKSAD